MFVRLTACDLRCYWCDTPYAFHEGRKMSVDEVLATWTGTAVRLVGAHRGRAAAAEGGLPADGPAARRGKTVLVETGGHVSIERVPRGVIKIMDVKCPGSGEAHRMDWANLDRLAPHDEVKFVHPDRADYEYARDVLARTRSRSAWRRCYFSPVHGVLDARDARRMGARGSPRRARAAAGAQVHLGPGHEGSVGGRGTRTGTAD